MSNATKTHKRYLEYLPLSHIQGADRNPREHDLGAIHESMNRFGFVNAVILDDQTGKLVAGHGRIQVLRQKQQAGETPPEGIEQNGEDWLVPVQRGKAFAKEEEALGYQLADNKLTELARWEDAGLADVLEVLRQDESGLQGTGFDEDDLHQLLFKLKAGEPLEEAFDIDGEKAQKKWEVQNGQVWKIGSHRLMCGDATNEQHVHQLYQGIAPWLMVTDPPYGVNYDPKFRCHLDKASRKTQHIANDDRASWGMAFQWFPGDVAYVWHASTHCVEVAHDLLDQHFEIRAQLIWRKQNLVIGRGAYSFQHEPCWYAVRKGHKSRWCGDKTQSTVWDIASLNPIGHSGVIGEDMNVDHAAQKPLECMARPIRNHGGPGDVVYDPFLGSGTTMVAAHGLDRICYGMEIEPKFVALILERMTRLGVPGELCPG